MKRDGFALLFVLIAVAALELLTLSSLALATHEQVAAHAQLRMAHTRRKLDVALRNFVKSWPAELQNLPVGGQQMGETGDSVRLLVERHNWGTYQVTASLANAAAHERSMVLRMLDAQLAFNELNDAVIAAGPVASTASSVAIDYSTSCVIPLASIRPSRAFTVARVEYAPAFEQAVIDSAHAVALPGYALGGLRWSELAAIADTILGDAVSLADTSWTVTRLIYTPGDLAVTGGSAVGLLLVQGNLFMSEAEFSGIVVVGGALQLTNGSRIQGSVRIQGANPSLLDASEIIFDRCRVAHAVLAAPARLGLVGGRRFVPTF